MDSEVVQALIVLLGVLVESGLFYVVVRKVWKSSRLEAGLMAIGLKRLGCVGGAVKYAGTCCFGQDGWGFVGCGA
jgi:hypothetical protein